MTARLLLVDDEPNIPRAIRRALRGEDYDISIASNGEDALSLLDDNGFDVVISDYRMPGMTGTELLNQVGQRSPDTVRMMLSGQADMEAVIDAVNNGAIFKFLTKPWSNDALRANVREAVDLANSGQREQATQWLTRQAFCDALGEFAQTSEARVVTGEVRNGSFIWGQLREEEREELASAIARRCLRGAGSVLVEHASIERGLFAFATTTDSERSQLPQLVREFTKPITVNGQSLTLQVAFGYANIDQTGDPERALRHALAALTSVDPNDVEQFAAYDETTQANLHLRHSLERDMSVALIREEFYLLVQPQVSAKDFSIVGGESLIRWHHPTHGLISPLQFIDLAERNGFIQDIGAWAMSRALDILRNVRPGIRVSVNVSPRQFSASMTDSWVSMLTTIAESEPALLNNLELEVTESTIMENPKACTRLLEDLKQLGVRVALDDFGTGHSSLATLNALPVDALKLDRALITDVATNERTRKLTSHLARMARDLEFEIIAEGIETHEQTEFCQQIGCDVLQGFGFYQPIPVNEFTQLLETEKDGAKH